VLKELISHRVFTDEDIDVPTGVRPS